MTPRLGVLLSGGGRSLQNLIDRIAAGTLDAEIAVVISDRDDAGGIERAARAGVAHAVLRDVSATFDELRAHDVDLVCLAGYLRLLAPIPEDFARRVINIHPALLPKHGGKGYYGDRVHAAVLEAGESVTGCTVHYCDDIYDHGAAIVQRTVPVELDDDVHTLAARVFEAECEAYPEAIAAWVAARPS